jgi:hypothetical protein
MSDRIGLVGCGKRKLRHAAPAQELYVGPLFRGRRAYVDRTCSRWFILSAKHGLVDPEQVLEPYDMTLDDASAEERRRWSRWVIGELHARLGNLASKTFEAHAGVNYLDFGLVDQLEREGARVYRPAKGLSIFDQQAFYSRQMSGRSTAPRARERSVRGRSPGGKYSPLAAYLAAQRAAAVKMAFADLEALVGPLPSSARNHRSWWANDRHHAQARSWLSAGWRASRVDLSAGIVILDRYAASDQSGA